MEQASRPAGVLDDYAFTVLACLDAYEATSDLRYLASAEEIAARMISGFYDESDGGFFDLDSAASTDASGALTARRKPFQDSPTPAGDSVRCAGAAAPPCAQWRCASASTRQGDAGGLCRSRRTVWHLRWHLRSRIRLDGSRTHAGGGDRRRPAGRRVIRGSSCSVRAEQNCAQSEGCRRVCGRPCRRHWRKPSLPFPDCIEDGAFAMLCSGFACQPPISTAKRVAARSAERH